MGSQMSPKKAAQIAKKAATANEVGDLARRANGHSTTSVDATAARAELEQRFGKRGANRQQEIALQRAGAAPKLLSKARWFG